LHSIIKHTYCKIFDNSHVRTSKARSDVTADNWAYVDITICTENDTLNIILKLGTRELATEVNKITDLI